MSFACVGGVLNEKLSDPEKSDIYPTGLSIPDIGSALVDTQGNTLSSASSQTLSSTSSITYPIPARTRQNSGPASDGIEISSVHGDSLDMDSPKPSAIPPPFQVSFRTAFFTNTPNNQK